MQNLVSAITSYFVYIGEENLMLSRYIALDAMANPYMGYIEMLGVRSSKI